MAAKNTGAGLGITTGNGLLSKVDTSTVLHAAAVVVIVLLVYHFVFNR